MVTKTLYMKDLQTYLLTGQLVARVTLKEQIWCAKGVNQPMQLKLITFYADFRQDPIER